MRKPKITAAVGYIRVSTETQADEGVSLLDQQEKIKVYCQLHDLEMLGIEADEGISGKKTKNRPGLQRAMALACERKALVVVYSLSRFARSTHDCIELVAQLEKCGANLASITEKFDTSTASGNFFFQVMAALGEMERRRIAETTLAAMTFLRTQKRRISGYIPYGFMVDPTRPPSQPGDPEWLVPHPDESEHLALILTMREKGYTLRKIGQALEDNGAKPRGGTRWYASSVRSILNTSDMRLG